MEQSRPDDIAKVTVEALRDGEVVSAATYHVRKGGALTVSEEAPVKCERNIGGDVVARTLCGPTSLYITALLDPSIKCHTPTGA